MTFFLNLRSDVFLTLATYLSFLFIQTLCLVQDDIETKLKK